MDERNNTNGELTPEEQEAFVYVIKQDDEPNCESGTSFLNEEAQADEKDVEKAKKKISKKLLNGISKVAAAAIAIAVAIWLFFFRGAPSYILYIKDNEIFFSDYSKNGTFQLTERLLDGEDKDFDDNNAQALGMLTFVCDDGTIFYYDKVSDFGSLFYKNSKKPEEDAMKIDSGLSGHFEVTKDAKYVVYLKDDILYEYSVKKDSKEKIASEVENFYMSEDGDDLLFMNADNSLYYNKRGQGASKIDGDIESLEYITSDFEHFYYIKDKNLYVNTPDGDRTKIASEIQDIETVYDSGELYYTVKDEATGDTALYYYGGSGSKNIMISDSINYVEAVSNDKAVIAYSKEDDDGNKSYLVAIKSKSSEINEQDIYKIMLSPDGTTLYYLTNKSTEDNTVDLFKININDKFLFNRKLFDSNVYYNVTMLKNGSIIYCKDFKADENTWYYGSAELYMNGERIDYDVYTSMFYLDIAYIESENKLVYFTDWNSEKEYGTLKIFDKEAKKISDDVHSFDLTADNKVAYLKDYSTKHHRGELYVFDGGESKKIDEDVGYIIPTANIDD